MLLTTGNFSFGFAPNNYLELTNAVTVGARDVAVSRRRLPLRPIFLTCRIAVWS
jgi:hypothetical protein